MINIKEIKYEINPVEINAYPDEYDWSHSDCKAAGAWLALSEPNSVPSLFIEFDSFQMAISIEDLQTLLALPIYEINPVEINAYSDKYDWSHSGCKPSKAWLALSEVNSVPSLFIEFRSTQMAFGIEDLQTLLALPIVQKLLDEQSK